MIPILYKDTYWLIHQGSSLHMCIFSATSVKLLIRAIFLNTVCRLSFYRLVDWMAVTVVVESITFSLRRHVAISSSMPALTEHEERGKCLKSWRWNTKLYKLYSNLFHPGYRLWSTRRFWPTLVKFWNRWNWSHGAGSGKSEVLNTWVYL